MMKNETVTISNLSLSDAADLLELLRQKGYHAERAQSSAPAEPQGDAPQDLYAQAGQVELEIAKVTGDYEAGKFRIPIVRIIHKLLVAHQAAEQRATRAALETAARWCEQQTGDFAPFFTAESAAQSIRALAKGASHD